MQEKSKPEMLKGKGAWEVWLLFVLRGLFFVALAVVVYAGMKAQPVPQVVGHFDLMLHFGAFGLLSALWVLGFSRELRLLGLVGLLVLGGGIELWQGWALAERQASFVDMAANASGVILGGGIAWSGVRVLFK